MVFNKILKWVIVILLFGFFIYLYKRFNPIDSNYFPRCLFREITGYKCPGCGSQRSIHYLLNFDIKGAIRENILLVLSLPYILLGFIFDLVKLRDKRLLRVRSILFGYRAIIIIFIIVILFWVIRNLEFFQYYFGLK
jgi:hypothetical protein